MISVLIIALLCAWLVAGYLVAPRRETTIEERTAKLREKSYARWYATQLRVDAAHREKAKAASYRTHKAVNLLPAGYAQVER